MARPKIALTWLSGCGGCEESILDIAEGLPELASRMDIVFWPIALDHKLDDIARLEDQEILATLINGAIRNDEHYRQAMFFRKKSKYLIAHGSCAHTGGVVGLGNLHSNAALLRTVYVEMPTVEEPPSLLPGGDADPAAPAAMVELAPLQPRVHALNQVVPVDFVLPGCPPTPESVKQALTMLVDGPMLPVGSIFAESKALCDSCPRRPTLSTPIAIKRFKRLHETDWEPGTCFLTQHLVCLGPVTRGGCRARCINANMPCRGCFGPTDGICDQGAKAVAFLATLMDARQESEAAAVAETPPDLVGLVSQYGLAASILGRKEKGTG
jgi:F420-non-reducing hydrogenase small subunit